MTQPRRSSSCPHLGLVDDPMVIRTRPNAGHRCHAHAPATAVDDNQQATYCLTAAHSACPFYVAPRVAAGEAPAREGGRGRPVWLSLVRGIVVLAIVLLFGAVYGRDILNALARSAATAAGTGAATPLPLLPGPPASASPTRAVTSTRAGAPTEADAVATPYYTPTPEPGGRTVTLAPRMGSAGWWAADDLRSHMGDSFLYAGYEDGKVFVSVVSFDLRGLPRGAPVRSASLRLTGLRGDRFHPEAGGSWTAQFLGAGGSASVSIPGAAEDDPARANFQQIFNAASVVTLFPALSATDLAEGRANSWNMEAAGLEWLAKQIADGVEGVTVRLIGPVGGSPTLFAWDGGTGSQSRGNAPQLVLSFGRAPATPPPLPTEQVVVLVPTVTPANVLTAAAYALDATRAASAGTPTPVPRGAVTATPLPANLATAQAQGYRLGMPPLVIYTPTPANAATAAADAAYATAVAVTTGTFTPVPTDAVTPIIVQPTPRPANVITAAAQSIAATAQATRIGTPTPLAYGALVATVTPDVLVAPYTATPANVETVAAQVAYATAVAVTTGTFTPVARVWTPTPEPPATPLPLLFEVTPRPTPTPTGGAPSALPADFRGKILFRTDRDGPTRTYLLDPATGALVWVTQDWPYAVAQSAVGNSADGRRSVIVRSLPLSRRVSLPSGEKTDVTDYPPQLVVLEPEFKVERQITHSNAVHYDPAWSPIADRIAYVSIETGVDEIYTTDPQGENVHRLTTSTWEWNKHPTWSPDGSQIVFWSNRVTGRKQLWVVNADGSNLRQFLDSPWNDWDPIWVK